MNLIVFVEEKEVLFLKNRKESLEIAIRNIREMMINHAEINGLLDEETLNLSRQLDQLIIEHIRMKYSNTKF